MHYLKGWFFLDLIAIIPYDLFQLSKMKLLRCLKLLRIIRVGRIIERWQAYWGFRYSVRSLYTSIFSSFLLAHCGACLWGYTPKFIEQDTSWVIEYSVDGAGALEEYLAAFYWSVMTITTVGYGDVPAQNSVERAVAICFMCIGGCTYAYIVGNICSVVSGMS